VCGFVIAQYLCPSDTSGPDVGLWPTGTAPSGKTEVGNWAFSNYGANYQVFGNPNVGDYWYSNFDGNSASFAQITDGASNTIGFAEKYRRCGSCASIWGHGNWDVPYMALFAYGSRGNATTPPVGYTSASSPPGAVGPGSKPVGNPEPWATHCDPTRTTSAHPGGLNVAMMDGAVKFVSFSIDADVWWGACTINGAETQSLP
jgi:prepilin-type processing-associated H-X9-DG protein